MSAVKKKRGVKNSVKAQSRPDNVSTEKAGIKKLIWYVSSNWME